jgi:LPPG:FO 2-phospho-L-lactate transferase
MQKITVLAGGTGGATFSTALVDELRSGSSAGADSVTIIATTAADAWLHGLKVSPDLDRLMYALAGSTADSTRTVVAELAAYGVEPAWFAADDREIATQLVRTQMLEAGFPLSQVTEALTRRWLTPLYADRVRLLPATDDRVETHVAVADAESPSGQRAMHVHEYRSRGLDLPILGTATVGLDAATPAPGVLEAIAGADRIHVVADDPLTAPGLLDLPGIRDALASTTAEVTTTP